VSDHHQEGIEMNPRDATPANAKQLRRIALLNRALHNQEPTEEYFMSFGSAGELIRYLSHELGIRRLNGITRHERR